MKTRQLLHLPRLQSAIVIAALVVGFNGYFADPISAQEWMQVEEFGAPSMELRALTEETAADDAMPEAAPPMEYEPVEQPPCNCQVCQGKAKCPGVNLDPGHPGKTLRTMPGDINEGDCPSIRYRMDDCVRSGDPRCVYQWAVPSVTNKYSAWYVGGGAVFRGRGRTAEEGTWGLDYDGFFGHARTWLNYTCGKRQGGEGAYQTEHVPIKKKLSQL